MKQSFLTLGAAFALAGASQAAVLVDDFESISYPKNNTTSMNGLGTWSVTNGFSTGNGENAVTSNQTFNGSTGAALIGGFIPDIPGATVLSSNAPSVSMFDMAYPAATFTMDFGIWDATGANPQDSYSISLGSTGGNLLTIDLTPAGTNLYNINFTSAFFASVSGGTLDTLDIGDPVGPPIVPYPYYGVMFQTYTTNGVNMLYNLKDLNGGLISSGTLADGLGLDTALTDVITGLSISTNNAGSDGFIIIDNVSVIPEPSSALLGLLGATFAFTRRRRA